MLTLTDNAVVAIRSLTSQPELPAETGLRIMTQQETQQETQPEDEARSFQLALAASPVAGDQVIEAEGARVFVEAGAAAALDDKALDAQVDSEGSVSFSVAEQNA